MSSHSVSSQPVLIRSIRRGTALAVAAAVATLFALAFGVFAGSASASPYPPTTGCTVSTTTADAGPGDSVTFVGSGFAANQTVALSVPSLSAALGTVTTTSKGSFSGSFTWPASVNGASAQVQASAPSATCSFTLVNHHTGTSGSGGHRTTAGGSGLSHTGFQALTATVIAVGLIGAGAMFLGLSRRKRV